MRKILIALLAGVVVVVGGVLLLASNLDTLVKTAIEEVGTRVAGVAVSVSKVSLSLKEGKASIEGLVVANPKGFATPYALKLGLIAVELDPAKVTKKPLEMTRITIAGPEINYEIGTGGSNLEVIKAHAQAFSAHQGGAESKPTAAAADKPQSTPLIIDHLAVTGGKVALATPIPGMAASVKLGDLTFSGLGRAAGGIDPAQVAVQVLDGIIGSAVKSATATIELSPTAMPSVVQGVVKGLLGK